ncbi:ArsR/SmtB family transcription factor [Dethiothermospora halolimnae]|uniref:ArsR/SmtB family transcription factor n=1 Tax=Dethiothermospora halolimnae TaxID=3114390 RepID=UPI003CCBDAD8
MEIVKQLKALGDETRLKIIILLLNKKFCVRSLAKKLNISQSAVSQHLKLLRDCNLVQGEKKGYWVHYDVKKQELSNLAKSINKLINLDISLKDEIQSFIDINILEECTNKCKKKQNNCCSKDFI